MKVIGAILLALALSACGNAPPATLSMRAADWNMEPQFNYFPGNPGNAQTLHPQPVGSGWAFDIPVEANWPACLQFQPTDFSTCFLVGYVTTPYGGPAQHAVSAILQIDTTGAAQFNYMGQQFPGNASADAEVVLMLEHRNDDLAHDLWRWYAIADKVYLAPGQFSVSVPLDVADWENVNGSYSLAERTAGFADVLANLGNVGITFGGGCCADHGVDVSGGTARFTMLSFTIQ